MANLSYPLSASCGSVEMYIVELLARTLRITCPVSVEALAAHSRVVHPSKLSRFCLFPVVDRLVFTVIKTKALSFKFDVSCGASLSASSYAAIVLSLVIMLTLQYVQSGMGQTFSSWD